ncbi:hypothetical protein AAG906_038126 [Vitis piasezkii]
MAKGTDSEEFVVLSRVRPGCKREFAFAVKAQSAIAGSLGRTRTRNDRGGLWGNGGSEISNNKRQKSSVSNSEKNNAEERSAEDGIRSNEADSMDNEAVRSGDAEQGNHPADNPMHTAGVGELKSCPGGEEESKDDTPAPMHREDAEISETQNADVVENATSDQRPRRVSETDLMPNADTMEISAVNNGEENTGTKRSSGLVPRVPRRFPAKLKELLDTRILEDLPVQYIRGSRTRGSGESGLRGVIKGSGILCSCNSCKGTKVVTPNLFELHAGSSNKRPPEYIYLENGTSLRGVMNAWKNAALDSLDEAIRVAIGCSMIKKSTFCLNCKGRISEAGIGNSKVLCLSCLQLKESQASPSQVTGSSDSHLRSPKPSTISRSAESVSKCSSSGSKSYGRVTKKDLSLHKLVFGENGLPEGTEVGYYVRGQQLLVGYKRGSGIFCTCCNSEVSPSQFEAHAGWASRRKPYLHIYTSNGVSLHEFSISLSRGREISVSDNDDLCSICLDGGNLLCCDGCPRVFHKECVSLANIPKGKWFCKFCNNMLQKEKFVEHNANAVAAGRVAGVDPIEQITKRCIRIVNTQVDEMGGCALCRRHEFSRSGFGPRTVMLCDQCEKEFHVGCLREHDMDDLKEVPKGKWFCCHDCKRINSSLQKLVVHGEEELPHNVLTTIKEKYGRNGSACSKDPDIKWRLICGRRASSIEAGSLLSQALSIFHEQFDPIADAAGRDLLPDMVHGKSTREWDFGGMYCAILTISSQVVSAAAFRIFGKEVAELPLVATRSDCQGQGYFQTLFSCLEGLLGVLEVRSLVLPAAEGAESIWTNKFGFNKVTQEQRNNFRRDYQMMTFQGTLMLQKLVPR